MEHAIQLQGRHEPDTPDETNRGEIELQHVLTP